MFKYRYRANIQMVTVRQVEIESKTPLTAGEIIELAEKKAAQEFGKFDYSQSIEIERVLIVCPTSNAGDSDEPSA